MKNLVFSLLPILLISACVSTPNHQQIQKRIGTPQSVKLMAQDLLFVLHQIFPPEITTVQYIQSDHLVTRELLAQMKVSGFGLQKVTDDRGPNLLTVTDGTKHDKTGKILHMLEIKIGPVSVKRTYKTNKNQSIYPMTRVILQGTKHVATSSVDVLSLLQEDYNLLSPIDYRRWVDMSIRIPKISLVTDKQAIDSASTTTETPPDRTGLNASKLETNNVYFTNESNFLNLTQDHNQIRQDIIQFESDSFLLGNTGKQLVKHIFSTFNSQTDIITLLGCSNGHTEHEIGNQGLALGRSKNVLLEFVSLGVPRNRIMDEGCWAPKKTLGRYPDRGVVVDLKRRKS